VPDYSSEHIRALRDRLKLSQAVLATVLNTSLSTVRQWEIGEKHPSGSSLELRRPLLSSCAGTSRC
jgi:putative transcriptional regulator